jgi:hypothetical protein
MGKGGANPYPLWWASEGEDEQPHRRRTRDKPSTHNKERKRYDADDIYKSKNDKEKEYWDEYYREKSWSQREQERKEQFKRDFMGGKYFYDADKSQQNENVNHSYFDNKSEDIDPIFKIKKSSSEDDFKKAYRKLILKHHPDKGGEPSFFIKVQEAYENIKNYFSMK